MAQNDGRVAHGSYKIRVLETGEQYILSNFDTTKAATVLEVLNENGAPYAQKIIEGFESGSVDIQLASASQAIPRAGYSFLIGSTAWLFADVGQTRPNNDVIKAKATIRKMVNPLIYWTVNGVDTAADLTFAGNSAISSITLKQNMGGTATWSVDYLPSSLSLNSSTGVLSGTPETEAAGSYNVTFTVSVVVGGVTYASDREIRMTIT